MLRLLLEAIKEWVEEVLASFHAMYLGYATPQMYGAKGDGVTDDTQAVKQALQRGGVVFFPQGVYRVEIGKLYIAPSSDLTIKGTNAKIELFVGNSTNISGLVTLKSDNGCDYLNIYGIELSLDINDSTTFNNDIKLLRILGQFHEINIDNVTIHAGGTNSILPNVTCLWAEIGANSIAITNCLIENFTNKITGGCVWINPQYPSDNGNVHTDIEKIIIQNCDIRNTNHDECVAIWVGSNDDNKGLHNILINDNKIVHKNWNGECIATANLVSVYSRSGVFEANVLITNNQIISDKANSTGLIKCNYCDSAVVDGNTIEINGVGKRDDDATLDFPNCPIIRITEADMIFSNNAIKFNVANNVLNFDYSNGSLELRDNNITSASNILFYCDDNVLASGDKRKSIIYANTFMLTGESGQNRITLSPKKLSEVHRVTRFNHNYINGRFVIASEFAIMPTEIIGNTFGLLDDEVINYYPRLNGGMLSWINNKNIKLFFQPSNLLAKLSNFKYVGYESDVTFLNNSAVDTFFDNSNFAYLGDPSTDIDFSDIEV